MHAEREAEIEPTRLGFMTILQSNLMTGNSISKETGI